MKECLRCGTIFLSKQETQIIQNLPATTKEIADKLKIKVKIVYAVLSHLTKLDLVNKYKIKGKKSIHWYHTKHDKIYGRNKDNILIPVIIKDILIKEKS